MSIFNPTKFWGLKFNPTRINGFNFNPTKFWDPKFNPTRMIGYFPITNR